MAALYAFVREALLIDWLPFELLALGGQKLLEDENLAFNECGLVSDGLPAQRNWVFWVLVESAQTPEEGDALQLEVALGEGVLGPGSLGVSPTIPLPCHLILSNFSVSTKWECAQCVRVLCGAEPRWHSKCKELLGRV